MKKAREMIDSKPDKSLSGNREDVQGNWDVVSRNKGRRETEDVPLTCSSSQPNTYWPVRVEEAPAPPPVTNVSAAPKRKLQPRTFVASYRESAAAAAAAALSLSPSLPPSLGDRTLVPFAHTV